VGHDEKAASRAVHFRIVGGVCEPVEAVTLESRPHVVLNALALRPGGSGVQTYERELIRALAEVLDANMTAIVQSDATGELPRSVTPLRRSVSSGVRRAVSGLRGAGACDVFHGLDVDLPFRPGGRTVSTVHDLSVFDVPHAFSRTRVLGERMLLSSSIRRADAVIAVSNFTADRVRSRFGRECAVIGESPSSDMHPASQDEIDEVRLSYSLPQRFVLHVGTIEPRKNLGVLARACMGAEVRLVLAGMVDKRCTAPAGAMAVGYVPRPLLRGLYSAATLVAFSPLYEGFGLPAVEAMACGVPVVASRIPALVESLGEAAELVAPEDEEAWKESISVLLEDSDRREELATRGRRLVEGMSWRAAALQTAEVYRSLGARL